MTRFDAMLPERAALRRFLSPKQSSCSITNFAFAAILISGRYVSLEIPGRSSVFDELRAIQREFGYLPAEELQRLSRKLKVPVSQIHAVISFYPHFHTAPRAKLEVQVCSDMSCHLCGASHLRSSLQQAFRGMDEKRISIRDVSCLGRCDTAPAFSINDIIYSGMTAQRAADLIAGVAEGVPPPPVARERVVHKPATDPYSGTDQYQAIRKLLETRDCQGIIATLKAAGLRGLGGAGFPTGAKWEIVRNAPGEQKYIVCNADESEPGTIKDRFIMEHMPHLVIEGMVLAGLVTGANKGIIYLRHEYDEPREVLQREIDRCYRQGVLGSKIFGSETAFELEIFISPGGYICGEETALLEAIEGKRAEPRNKPPFPGISGLWNSPTVINNVETFTFAAAILVRGVEWFKSQGQNGAQGLKFVGVSGDVVHPGVFEVAMGCSYEELIFERAGGIRGGKKLLGYAPSGPSSGYLPASMVGLPLDFNALAAADSMVGSGAIVVCSDDRCMLDMALNAVRFYRNESCGKCVPCRMGTQKLVTILTRWCQGESEAGDLQLIEQLMKTMRLTSICGLGQIAHAPLTSVMKHFPYVIDSHLKQKHCPAGVCPLLPQ
jgi:NADH:ubiquinone oxidoreductase subunit F (NADH-binding)/NADH:ubiquinone oxidoreductase subunit E